MPISATGSSKATRSKAPAGFTVIELMVVLSVLVIAAGAMLPGFPAFMRGQHLNGTGTRLVGMARYAREWAMLHERAVVLEYDGEARQFTLSLDEDEPAEAALAVPVPANGEGDSPEESPEDPRLDEAYHVLRLPEDVQFEAGQIGEEERLESGGRLLFQPDGRCEDSLLVLSAGEQRATVRLEGRRGRVTLEAGDGLEESGNAQQ